MGSTPQPPPGAPPAWTAATATADTSRISKETQMRKLFWLFLFVPAMAFTQVSNPSIISVATAPTGSCSAGLPNQQVVSTGVQYSCQNIVAGVGTWGVAPSAYQSLQNSPQFPEGWASLNFGTIATQTCSALTFSLSGARATTANGQGDFVVPAWPSGFPSGVIGMMRVSASDTIEIRICNPTAVGIATPTLTYGAKMFR